jgi:uncharacterized protein
MNSNKENRSRRYFNPYVGGVLLGLVLIASNFISGRGLGASGAIKGVLVEAIKTVAPAHIEKSEFYTEYLAVHPQPLKSWLVIEVLGIVVGGFLSGLIGGRMKLKVEHSPTISSRRRLIFALLGGILFGLGSQIGRGCTSGSALSGMAVFSFGGIVTMMAIFGSAYAMAWFFRKNWIR